MSVTQQSYYIFVDAGPCFTCDLCRVRRFPERSAAPPHLALSLKPSEQQFSGREPWYDAVPVIDESAVKEQARRSGWNFENIRGTELSICPDHTEKSNA